MNSKSKSSDKTSDEKKPEHGLGIDREHDFVLDRGAINDIPLGELLDSSAEIDISDGIRPHWSQAGAVVFVTFRTKDSVPRDVILRLDREKTDWFRSRGLIHQGLSWKQSIEHLDQQTLREFNKYFNRQREMLLDTCCGKCVLRRPGLRKIVSDALLYFDGDRYRMGDFVVMPNHVHLLAAFRSPEQMRKQFDSWLHFTAFQINKAIGEKGHFWQQEPFDHLVRSNDQYDYLRDYIKDNPSKANLKDGEFYYRQYGEDSR